MQETNIKASVVSRIIKCTS